MVAEWFDEDEEEERSRLLLERGRLWPKEADERDWPSDDGIEIPVLFVGIALLVLLIGGIALWSVARW